jgi:acetoacetyl-CoA reductase
MSKKIALITGGIGGIGTAVCKQLAGQGYTVVAGHLPAEQEAAELWRQEMAQDFPDIDIAAGDVSKFASSADMVEGVLEKHSKIDTLVNCAGITRDGFLKKMPEENWYEVINANLNSIFNVTRQLIGQMTENGFGRVVNISSVNGQKGQFGQTNYSAAKAGAHGFTMALAQEVVRKGVTINTVSPGYVETRMTAAIDKEILDAIIAQIPYGRMAKPEEIAHVVGFLCMEESRYITGANIPVNGGMYMS